MFEFLLFLFYVLVDMSYLNSLSLDLWSLLNPETTSYVDFCPERVKINLKIF